MEKTQNVELTLKDMNLACAGCLHKDAYFTTYLHCKVPYFTQHMNLKTNTIIMNFKIVSFGMYKNDISFFCNIKTYDLELNLFLMQNI